MEETTTPKRRATRRQAAADTTPKLSEYGHVQPQALEFEEAVLGALMIDSDAIGRLGGMLKPESFYDKRNQQKTLMMIRVYMAGHLLTSHLQPTMFKTEYHINSLSDLSQFTPALIGYGKDTLFN